MKIIKFEIEKKKFKKLIKAHAKNNVNYNSAPLSILAGIKFELKKDELTIVSSNGCVLLETITQVGSAQGKGFNVYNGFILKKISFLKPFKFKAVPGTDILEIILNKNYLIIKDVFNNIIYNVPTVIGIFPEYKRLMPKVTEEYTTIGVNADYLAQLKDLTINERTKLVKLSFKNNSQTSAICINTEAENTQSRMIVMPIEMPRKEE